MHIHKWSLSDIENILPWELEVYSNLLINHINAMNNSNSGE